jgi:hypothetical protein
MIDHLQISVQPENAEYNAENNIENKAHYRTDRGTGWTTTLVDGDARYHTIKAAGTEAFCELMSCLDNR